MKPGTTLAKKGLEVRGWHHSRRDRGMDRRHYGTRTSFPLIAHREPRAKMNILDRIQTQKGVKIKKIT
jgi:hypothetical protein